MHFTYCSMSKGTCRAEATSNSEKIKPVALAVIELRFSEGISQLRTVIELRFTEGISQLRT